MRERDRRWIRWFWTLSVEAVLVCALCSAAAADPAQFPRPPQLEPVRSGAHQRQDQTRLV